MPSLYLYAIARADATIPDGLSGLNDQPVRSIAGGDIMALASAAPDGRIRPRRRNLKAHHEVIKRMAASDTVLPMAFGVIADSETHIRSFLTAHSRPLHEQLDALNGHVEVGVRVSWNVDDIFAHFVERYDELRALRDSFFGNDRSASRQEMIQLGERFEALLEAERRAHQSTVEDHLRNVCPRIVADDPRDESEAVNLACLVPRTAMDAFEEALHEAASDFDDVFTFTYTDPLAPYSFAEVSFGDA